MKRLKVKALVSFCGVVTMGIGDVADIKDKAIVDDLLQAGYVEKVETKKRVKSDENK